MAAHRRLVSAVVASVDLDRVASAYPHIFGHFPASVLYRYSNDPPYYCHYMLWRLATLRDPQLRRLDELLELAETIAGWKRESPSLLNSRAFEEYWSLVWQLQVAEYLDSLGFELEWGAVGPDLVAMRDGDRLYVECLVPRKQYGKVLFIEELLRFIHPQLRVENQVFLRIAELTDSELDDVADTLAGWLQEAGRLEELEQGTERAWPVLIPLPETVENVIVYMEGDDLNAYQPGVRPLGGGDPTNYLDAVLREAVRGKSGSNRLAEHHPNVLAVNLLLGDLQLGNMVAQPRALNLREVIDELVLGSVGIDVAIQPGMLQLVDRDTGAKHNWVP